MSQNETQSTLLEIINTFPPIELQEMRGIKLMNRIDKKFVATRGQLVRFLREAAGRYYVQDFHGRRLMPYHTIYFDTPEHDMYTAHETGRMKRYKVRLRMYENEMEPFVEVKRKNNRGRTKKKRILLPRLEYLPEARAFVAERTPYDPDTLSPTIENRFHRITLVNNEKTERLTIDVDLSFHNLSNGSTLELPDHVIIELKRDGLIPSPATSILRHLRIKKCGFSKMAMGTALTDPAMKQNRFKQRIHYVLTLPQKVAQKDTDNNIIQ